MKTIKKYVVRDNDSYNSLLVFNSFPIKKSVFDGYKETIHWESSDDYWDCVSEYAFPEFKDLKWDDDPIEITITIP